MKMFRMGLENGKPKPGEKGVQPEWFYKGNGTQAVAPGSPLTSPAFALDGGEEPEMAGIYVIAADGSPFRLGFAVANEFSDHVTERINYLYLAHSGLRQASFGPEIRIGAAPDDIRGFSVVRNGTVLWEKPLRLRRGEHVPYLRQSRIPPFQIRPRSVRRGDIHVHMFGTATLSFGDGIRTETGDVFEIGRMVSACRCAIRWPLPGKNGSKSATSKDVPRLRAARDRQEALPMTIHQNLIAGEWVGSDAIKNINLVEYRRRGGGVCPRLRRGYQGSDRGGEGRFSGLVAFGHP